MTATGNKTMALIRDLTLAALLALVMGWVDQTAHQREKAQARATLEAYEAIGAGATDAACALREGK